MTRRSIGLLSLLVAGSAYAGTYDLVPEVGGLPSGTGTARSLQLHFVNGFTRAPDGSFYVAGYYSSAVWHVLANGSTQVVAGTPGVFGDAGDGALATTAHLSAASDVALASNGDLYVADFLNWKIKRIDHATGVITTVMGTGAEPYSVDGPGGDPSDDSEAGAQATAFAVAPLQITIANGALYVADQDLPRILRVDLSTHVVTVVAGSGVETYSVDGPGGDPSDDLVSGSDARQAAFSFGYGGGMAVAADGTVYVADTGDCVVRKIDPTTHVVTTVAGNGEEGYGGDGDVATAALLDNPYDVALGPNGALYISDQFNNRIRRVAAGTITTVAGVGAYGWADDDGMPSTGVAMAWPRGVEVDSTGTLYFADAFNHRVRAVSPSGAVQTIAGMTIGNGVAAASAALNDPAGLAAHGNALLIADTNNYRIRSVDAGTIRTVAGSGFPFFAGDNGPALAAGIRAATGVAINSAGDVVFTDVRNNRLRRIDHATGLITTIAGTGQRGFTGDGGPATAAQLARPLGVAFDSTGRVVFVDSANNRVRRIDLAGDISTVVSFGDATEMLALDASDNIYVTVDDHTIRRIDHATAAVTTIAGTIGTLGFAGDGGPATSAQLDYPLAIAIGSDNAIWFVDSEGTRVRRIAADGTISTVAGTGTAGLVPAAGGPGLTTAISALYGLAITSDGKVHVVSDQRVFTLVPHVEPTGPDGGTMMPDAGMGPAETGETDTGCGCDSRGGLGGFVPLLIGLGFAMRKSRRAGARR